MKDFEIDYVLTHAEHASAVITFMHEQTAELRSVGDGLYKLLHQSQHWLLNRRVDGVVSPFSITVLTTNNSNLNQKEILKIKDHIFLYKRSFYMLGGIPEGGRVREHLVGAKYICRLTNFPFAHPDHIDMETKNRLKRHRGIPVGQFYGLGSSGFHVKLANELKDIALPLAASIYLTYSSI